MKIEDLEQEMYEYIQNKNLTEEETQVINSYIQSLLETFSKVIDAQQKILENPSELEKFKNLVLENIKEGD